MCSAAIITASSCYVDNFSKIFAIVGTAIVMGLIVGTLVAIITKPFNK